MKLNGEAHGCFYGSFLGMGAGSLHGGTHKLVIDFDISAHTSCSDLQASHRLSASGLELAMMDRLLQLMLRRWGWGRKWTSSPNRPNLQSGHIIQLTRKHPHVTVSLSVKRRTADYVMIVDRFYLGRSYITWQIYPNRIFHNAKFEILAMQIDRIPFKLQMQISNQPDPLVVEGLRVCDELNQAYVLWPIIRTTFRVLASHLR
jgi:hypothetical protein